MKGDKLFLEYYEPGLMRHKIDNVVLRTYTHIRGFATDDPDKSTKIIYTPRTEVDRRMDEIYEVFGEDRGISLTSIVNVETVQRFLFLLDCALPRNNDNERELIATLKRASGTMYALSDGMVLRTQNSYHVVGFKPLTFEQWRSHMAQAILLRTESGQEVSDVRYVGHCLERDYGSLRMSDYQGKPTPDFICYLS